MDLRALFGSSSNSCLAQRLNLLGPSPNNESYSNVYANPLCRNRCFKKLEVYFQHKSFELLNQAGPLAKLMHQLLDQMLGGGNK